MSNSWPFKNHIFRSKCLIVSLQAPFQIKQLETIHPVNTNLPKLDSASWTSLWIWFISWMELFKVSGKLVTLPGSFSKLLTLLTFEDPILKNSLFDLSFDKSSLKLYNIGFWTDMLSVERLHSNCGLLNYTYLHRYNTELGSSPILGERVVEIHTYTVEWLFF